MKTTMSMLGSPDFEGLAADRELRKFDFWCLCATQIAALVGMYWSIFGPSIGKRAAVSGYLLISLVYAPTTAAIASRLPRRVGLPVLLVLEGLRSGWSSIRTVAWPLIGSAAIGIALAYCDDFYGHIVTKWLGNITARPKDVFVPDALGLVSAAISEEILFRGCILPILAAAIELSWRHRVRGGQLVSLWTANVSQALIFGAMHIYVGRGVLSGKPWYVRLPLISQTWDGLILGVIYWKYGIESAMLYHTAADLTLLAKIRMLRVRN